MDERPPWALSSRTVFLVAVGYVLLLIAIVTLGALV